MEINFVRVQKFGIGKEIFWESEGNFREQRTSGYTFTSLAQYFTEFIVMEAWENGFPKNGNN